jgi:hypothetical protein
MMHGNYFVVVDGKMQIRGYYSTDQPEEMSRLVHDVVRLATTRGGEGQAFAKGGPS